MRRILVIGVLISFVLNSFSQTVICPTGLTITGYEGPIVEGSTLQLQAIPTPSNTTYNIYKWSSNMTSVATVDDNGLVTAVSEGTATITCLLTVSNPGYFAVPNEQTATCTITVKKKSSNIIDFADAEVKRICVENWDSDKDGELSFGEAAAVTDIGDVFHENAAITSFDELAYFTGLTSIGDETFFQCVNMASVTIPNSVTSIGEYAFAYCTSLTNVTIPNSVTSISLCAFYYCSGLTSVAISNSLDLINLSVFEGCTNLASVSIPNSVTTIYSHAFKDCTSLTSVTIPNSVTSIYNHVFEGCTNLTTMTIPSSVTSIYQYAFKDCSRLTSIDLSTNLTSIAEGVFNGCSGLTSITIPGSVKSIDNYAFSGCRGLTSIIIPNRVTLIGKYAFSNCSGLISATISKSVTSIGEQVFYGCNSLKTIVVESGNTKYDSRDNCNAIIETASNTLEIACNSTVIPNTVTALGLYAFNGCSGIISLTIPNSVASIPIWGDLNGTTTFLGCTNIESITVESGNTKYDSRDNCNALIVTATNTMLLGCKNTVIPNTVTTIAGYAFQRCSGLTSITIPNSVSSIGIYAFQKCTNLTSVTIPSSVTSISEYAFDGCTNLTTVTVGISTPISIKSNVFTNRANATLYVPKGSRDAYLAANYWKEFKEIIEKDFNIDFADSEVKRICVENWDADNDGELSFEEAAAVTDLGDVFKGNKTITSFDELQYFKSLTSIPDRAFDNCTHLSSLIMPEGLSFIGMGAFLHCAFESLYIPASVVEIGLYAYEGNKKLTSIQVDAANTHYDSRNQCNAIIETFTNTLIQGCKTTIIPSDIKKIGNFAFEFVDLTHIDLPQGLEEIAWCAFYGCSNLDGIVFPDGLKSIARYAFNGCIGLKDIVIPASVEYLGGAAFAGCYNIETLTVAPGSETYISPEGSNAIISKDGSILVVGSKNPVIPEIVVTIGEESFREQSLLTNISFPANLSTIKEYAFAGCTTLNEIDIPGSVESIGEYAFSGCHLSSVIVRRNAPIAITANVFTNRENAVLYVPKGCKDAYIAADYWKDFKEIVEIEDYLLGDVNGNDEIDIGDVVSIMNFLMGKEVACFIEKAADTNKNGQIDIGDVVTIINYLMGTIERFD